MTLQLNVNWIVFIMLAIANILFQLNIEKLFVIIPVIILLFIFSIFLTKLKLIDSEDYIFDIGFFSALVIAIYSIYPLINYIFGNFNFGELSDNRLRNLNINSYELGMYHINHIIYLSSFCYGYLFCREKLNIHINRFPRISKIEICTSLTLFLFFLVNILFFEKFFDISFRQTGYLPGESIAFESRLKVLPLLVLQVMPKLVPLLTLSKLLLLYIVISRSTKKPWQILLVIWVCYEIFSIFYYRGGRTGLAIFLGAGFLFMYRQIYRPKIFYIFLAGFVMFVAFNFFGLYRMVENGNLIVDLFFGENSKMFVVGNEFQSLLGTTFHVYRLVNEGIELPYYLYLNDIISVLPPSQLLPFEKISASEWYLRVLGISGTGQGYMWGVISQSTVGFGWIELIFRGGVLGYICALFHNWYARNSLGFLETFIYVYLCLKIYNTYRDTTFAFLSTLVWEILPFILIFNLFKYFYSYLFIKLGKLHANQL